MYLAHHPTLAGPVNADTAPLQKLAAVSPGQLMSSPHRGNTPNLYLKVFEILKQLVYYFFSDSILGFV